MNIGANVAINSATNATRSGRLAIVNLGMSSEFASEQRIFAKGGNDSTTLSNALPNTLSNAAISSEITCISFPTFPNAHTTTISSQPSALTHQIVRCALEKATISSSVASAATYKSVASAAGIVSDVYKRRML